MFTNFLAKSIKGINWFNQDKSVWILVKLYDSLNENAKIIREYILKTQIWAYRHLLNAPSDFGVNLPQMTLCRILNIRKEENERLLNKNKEKLDQKLDTPEEEEYWRDQDDGSYEKDLQDELDYIRQNGGDWIDD